MRRGQSLVVWAIAEGRKAAEVIDNDFGGKELSLALKIAYILLFWA